jgi:hypothetical protein
MASSDARPVPIKNTAYRHYFCFRKNDGTLITTWAGMDSEVSKDGGNFADCTNEATEIQTSGCGYIDLTSTEMNADSVVLKATVTNTDALPYVCTLFPNEGGDIDVDVTYVGGSSASGAGTIDANVVQISGDSTAADNLEATFDGTGYNEPYYRGVVSAGTSTTVFASTTTAIAAAADDVWNTWTIRFTSGANLGHKSAVTDWATGANEFTLTTAAPATPSASDTFILFKA